MTPQPAALEPLLKEVEGFALGDYASALLAGSSLDPARRQAIAEKLHQYTSLPVAYILKSDLRINVGQFEKNLLDDTDLTVGRLDTRFTGPHMDVLSREADYDPQSASISSARPEMPRGTRRQLRQSVANGKAKSAIARQMIA